MSDLFGPITRITLAFGLWVIPLAPLLAAAYALYAPLSRAMAKKPQAKKKTSEAVAIANASVLAAALSFGWTAWETLRLSQQEEGAHFLLEHVLRMVRVGQLDIALDLAFDPLASVVALATCGVALLMLVVARARGASPAFFGWTSLLLGATLLAVLADGLGLTLVSWEVAALAVLGLTRDARGFVTARATDAVLLVGAAMLFWGLGGGWSDGWTQGGEYLPDLSPRFAAVRVGAKPDADDAKDSKGDEAEERRREQGPSGGKGQLTMTAYPGALIFMDDSRSPLLNGDAPLRPPFTRFPIAGGLHSFRIHPGSGLDDYLVSHVSLGKDREIALGVFGATVTFAQMRDQLAVKDAKADVSPRATLVGRRFSNGVGLLTAACLFLFFGAAARSAQVPFHAALARVATASPPIVGALVAATASLLGVYLALRISPLTSLSAPASAVVALTGGVTAVAFAAMACRALDLRHIVAGLVGSELGLAMLGAGAGAPAAAALVLVTCAVGTGALWACVLALEPTAGTDVRTMGGLAKTMPATARVWLVTSAVLWVVSVPKMGLLTTVFASQGTGKVPGWLLFALGGVGAGLAAHAAYRAYLVVFDGKAGGAKASDPVDVSRTVAWLLGGLAAVGGTILGLGGRLVGKGGASIFGEWLEDLTGASSIPFTPMSSGLVWGLVLVVIGLGVAGWTVAKNRYGATRPADWAARESKSGAPSARRDADGEAPAVSPPPPASVALGVERWVLDGAYAAVGASLRAAATLVGAADEKLVGAGIDTLADRSARLDPRARAIGAAACILVTTFVLYLALRQHP